MAVGDTFIVGDYEYTVTSDTYKYVSAKATDTTKASYGALTSPFSHSGSNWVITSLDSCFKDCANMTAAPSITINSNVYVNMIDCFRGCTSLVSASVPEYAQSCSGMFRDCSSLTTINRIPNGGQSYANMFYGCSSLVSVPAFPNPFYTSGRGNNFNYMFRYCESLENVSLPLHIYRDSTLAQEIVPLMAGMFEGCESLETAPALPVKVTDLTQTFRNCFSLVSPPSIPPDVTNMQFCFDRCTSLETAPSIPAGASNIWCCFQNCFNLGGTMVAANSPTKYDKLFYATSNDIYIILTSSANAQTWRTIAQQYENVHIYGDNSSPTVELSAFRCDVNGNAAEEGTYANVTAVITIYEDAVPPGTNSLASKTFKIDGTASAETWTESIVSLTYTFTAIVGLGDTSKHTFSMSAVDAFDAESIEVSIILVSAAPAMDFYHGATDNGVSFGKLASQEGIIDSAWDYWEHGERAYPAFVRSTWSTSSDESTLPVTPCFVLDTTTGALYFCSGSGIARINEGTDIAHPGTVRSDGGIAFNVAAGSDRGWINRSGNYIYILATDSNGDSVGQYRLNMVTWGISYRVYENGAWGSWESHIWNSQASRTANTVLAAPNGSAGAATFRALVPDDVPWIGDRTTIVSSGADKTITTGTWTDLGTFTVTAGRKYIATFHTEWNAHSGGSVSHCANTSVAQPSSDTSSTWATAGPSTTITRMTSMAMYQPTSTTTYHFICYQGTGANLTLRGHSAYLMRIA